MSGSRLNNADPEFRKLLKSCLPSDFDGHTEFYRMTSEERLNALAALVRFVHKNKGAVNRKKSQ